MPIRREAEKTSTPGLYKVSYPIRPGSTEINVNYALPPSSTLSGKFVAEAARPFLVTPASVTLTGEGVSLTPKQPLPNAHVYLVDGLSFTVAIAGTGAMREQAAEGQPQQDDESGGAPVLQHEARVYTKLPYVLGLVFAILLLGGILLYRKGAA
jgi:hypothetical protein